MDKQELYELLDKVRDLELDIIDIPPHVGYKGELKRKVREISQTINKAIVKVANNAGKALD